MVVPVFSAGTNDSLLFRSPGDSNRTTAPGLAGLRKRSLPQLDTKWTLDESYGVNVNALLQKLSNEEERKVVSNSYKSTRLWTEKWRPRSFVDLVGNERCNRRILFWLRQWSPVVFQEELPDTGYQSHEKFEQDPLRRPSKRILLVHGPPGIGKTSVAHVVARQAGYSVMEINASDERAGERVRQKVHNSLFNNTFHEKPVLLIADEIDGSVENGFIKVLIDMLRSDSKATHDLILGKGKTGMRGHQSKKTSSKLLKRPIVCICNNVYASSLERLKPYCEIVSFQKPSDDALMERLAYVCGKEGVQLSKATLKEIAELSQGDLRNGLNNLQFMARNGDLSNVSDDQRKDIGVSWFRICNALFKKNLHSDLRSECAAMLRSIELSANLERIVEGCFTLYPQMRYSDSGITKPSKISDWLFFNDCMFKSMFEHNGELLRYCSFTPLEFHILFGDAANKQDQKIKTQNFELRESAKHVLAQTQQLMSNRPVSSQVYFSKTSLLLEVLPFVDEFLSLDVSKIRNASVRKQIIDYILPLFNEFGVSIQQTSNLENLNALILEPAINELVLLDEKKLKAVLTKRPFVLKFTLSKLEENKIRKRALDKLQLQAETDQMNKISRLNDGARKPVEFFKSQYTSLNKNIQTTTAQNSPSILNFRNNDVKKQSTPDLEEVPPAEPRIWVKYKEGFSNAVRKNITWSQLWD